MKWVRALCAAVFGLVMATFRLVVWCAVAVMAIPLTLSIWGAMKVRTGYGGPYGLDVVTTALLTAVQVGLVMLLISGAAYLIISIMAPHETLQGNRTPRQPTATIFEQQGRGLSDPATTVAHSRYATARDVLMHGITGADEGEN